MSILYKIKYKTILNIKYNFVLIQHTVFNVQIPEQNLQFNTQMYYLNVTVNYTHKLFSTIIRTICNKQVMQ